MARSKVQRIRTPYLEAAAYARSVRYRAARARPRLRAGEWRMLLTVIDHTAGWSLIEDDCTLSALAAKADLSRRHASRALHTLHDRGLIVWRAGDGPRKSTVALTRDDGLVTPGMTGVSPPGGPTGVTGGMTPDGHGGDDLRGSAQVPGVVPGLNLRVEDLVCDEDPETARAKALEAGRSVVARAAELTGKRPKPTAPAKPARRSAAKKSTTRKRSKPVRS